jgi:hypothetical protein
MGCVHSALWCKHCDSGPGCLYVWGCNGLVQEGQYARQNKRQPVALEVFTCTYCECYDSCCGGPPLLPNERET